MMARQYAVVVCALAFVAACAEGAQPGGGVSDDAVADGGDGSGGEEAVVDPSTTGAGGTTAASTAASTTSSTATTGTGTVDPVCDGTSDCTACQQCAFTGPCVAPYNACMANGECVALNGCLNGCSPQDQPCLDACAAAHPNGASDLQAAAGCVFCVACMNDCSSVNQDCS